LTNLVYGFGAIVILYFSGGTPEAFVFAGTLAYLMLGSSVYHQMMPLYREERASLDVGAMYAVMGALLAYALGLPWWAMLGVAAGSTGVLEYMYPGAVRWKIGAFLGAILALIVTREVVEWVPLGIALGLFGVALFLRDRHDTPKTPGHALWHVLTGVAFPFLFLAIY